MKLVTAAQMRAIDRQTIDHHGIPGPELMENAGREIAEHLLEDLIKKLDLPRAAVFCGKGNNGGDGFVIARYLHEAEVYVEIYYLGPEDKLSPDARLNFERVKNLGIPLTEVSSIRAFPALLDVDIIVDAVFGTGFSGTPDGHSAEMIEYINLQDCIVASVDLPSGLNADTGKAEGSVVEADYTYTLGLPKYGLFLSPGRELAGSVSIIDIGIPENVIAQFDFTTSLITDDLVAELLPYRKPDGHKGDFGKLLILAGSTGFTGAAALTGMAAARSGCGLIKIGCPSSTQTIIATKLTEVMTIPLPEVSRKEVFALRGLGEIRKYIDAHDALVIGPGIGTHHETKELMHRLVPNLTCPAIIDADGLNAFENAQDFIKNRKGAEDLVLTPHPGEFTRITGEKVPDEIEKKISLVIKTAIELNAVIVLKGSPTLIADPQGFCYLNPTGNNGMATGGSGDVLSGMIGSFLAQGLSPLDASLCGVYLHGLAGDFAAEAFNERVMIAGDIIDHFTEAFDLIESINE